MAMMMKGTLLSASITKGAMPPTIINNAGQVRHAANLKEVKGRIKSVQSIRKITKTMNMIATARLKASQARLDKTRKFFDTAARPLSEFQPAEPPKKTILMPITSDRGLCGAVNSQIVKFTKNQIKDREGKGTKVNIVCIGEKGPTQLQREFGEKILLSFGETSKKPLNFTGVSVITDKILENEFDSVAIIFNKFNSVISYTPAVRELPSPVALQAKPASLELYEFEDDNTLFHATDLVEYSLACNLFSSVSEASTSELGGRMSSMDNATKNAGDMIKRLTIEYNRRRQAAITTELNEIISGASAIE